jgi:hypothetical protein
MPSCPKPRRVVAPNITRLARQRDGYCLYGLWHKDGCSNDLDGHHIIPVGVGGPDILENVISLCRKHHTLAEARRIEPDELRRLMGVYHGYQYEENGFPILEA